VIDERDAYMAHALWAAATGQRAAAPAFVADSTHDGRTVFRYAMPDGAPGELVLSRRAPPARSRNRSFSWQLSNHSTSPRSR